MARHLLLFLVFAPIMGFSQGNLLPKFIQSAPQADARLIQSKIDNFVFIQKGKMKEARNEVNFLKSLVNESHKKFLKSYKAYSRFDEQFETGHYDCLTGTAFFSLILQALEIEYKIIETNYHIFLLIDTKKGKVLLETTDRLFGFKTDPNEVEKCLAQYGQNQLNTNSSQQLHYRYQVSLFREVAPTQLTGLLYFNQAVVAYNNHQWETCVERLGKARYIYDNPRVEELTQILATSISLSNLADKEKQKLLIHLGQFASHLPLLAIR